MKWCLKIRTHTHSGLRQMLRSANWPRLSLISELRECVCICSVFPSDAVTGLLHDASNPAQGRVSGTTCNLCLALFSFKGAVCRFFTVLLSIKYHICRLGNMISSTCFPEKQPNSQLFYYIYFVSECLFLFF